MSIDHPKVRQPRLTWLCAGRLDLALDKVTWLEPTRVLRQAGWKVTLIAAGSSGVRPVDALDVLFISCPNVYLVRQIVFHLRCLNHLRRNWNATDIVFFSQASAPWMMPLKLVRIILRKKSPLLVMDTRTMPMERSDTATAKDRLRGTFANLMNRLANYWTDGQTAITLRMANAVRIPANRLWGTWPSGANLGEFAPAQRIRRWPNGVEKVCLVYVGLLHCERNLMALCRAVEKANAQGMHFTLSLIGDGTERSALKDFALRSRGQVEVAAAVPHSQIPGMLAQAHVGVLPFPNEPQFRVSSPIKLFEYLGAGLAILATQIECHTDVIGNGKYVFWARDGSEESLLEALRQAWHARSSLAEMGAQAAAAAKDWTWQASAYKLKTALESGLAQYGGFSIGAERRDDDGHSSSSPDERFCGREY